MTTLSKAEILKQLKPCIICGSTLPIVRENVDFIGGTTRNIWQVCCPHKPQKPALWYELKTKWVYDPAELINRWNAAQEP